MNDWRKALDVFLKEWKNVKELSGVLVCGSYVTGNPSKRSDIDVHLVLKNGTKWRERGNRVVNGFLVEYFCNPPEQIRKYFKEDYNDRGTHAAVQFVTGEILRDGEGTIADLKKEAENWLAKPFEEISETSVEFIKYSIWDSLDNLKDLHENNREDFCFVYHNSLKALFDQYCQFLGIEAIPYYQIGSYLKEPVYLQKYLKPPFPDEEFALAFIQSVDASEKDDMVQNFAKLCHHVLNRMGGFSIDGWKMRSPIEK
ncbi:nucleotidyltransferase domain-containing protein [Bacillus sp. AK031]